MNSDSQCEECPENCAKCDKDTSKCTKCLEGFEFEIFNGTLTNKCVSFIYDVDCTFDNDIDVNGTTTKEVTKKQKKIIIAIVAVLISIGVISSIVTGIVFLVRFSKSMKALSSDYSDHLENSMDEDDGVNPGYN